MCVPLTTKRAGNLRIALQFYEKLGEDHYGAIFRAEADDAPSRIDPLLANKPFLDIGSWKLESTTPTKVFRRLVDEGVVFARDSAIVQVVYVWEIVYKKWMVSPPHSASFPSLMRDPQEMHRVHLPGRNGSGPRVRDASPMGIIADIARTQILDVDTSWVYIRSHQYLDPWSLLVWQYTVECVSISRMSQYKEAIELVRLV